MVKVKWACYALLEDIRANNDIPGKALNELLWSRYGVEMAQTSLYRVRNMALSIINGGNDTSYSALPSYCDVIKSKKRVHMQIVLGIPLHILIDP